MKFTGSGRPLDRAGMEEVCDLLGVADAEVWAVLTVETRGFGFLPDRRPQILYERHVFHKETKGRYSKKYPDISNEASGGYVGGKGEYARLKQALELDEKAALRSTSWGIGQVMGFNHGVAGYPDVRSMVEDMVRDESRQLAAMASFIKGKSLDAPLRRKNWAEFARGYNGAGYKKNDYDTRLAAAHAQWSVMLPDLTLRTAQAALTFLKLDPGPVDGLRGRRTRSALHQFQQTHGLPVTGELDRATEKALFSAAFGA